AAAERPAQEKDKPARTDRYGDPLPDGALVRLGTTRLRHTSQVNQVFFAPDGKTVASKGQDDTVELWDVATGKLVRSLRLGGDRVSFSGDGKKLASWKKNQLWLWDAKTGEQLHKIELKLELDQQVLKLALSSDGKTAASGEMGGVIRLW